MKKISYYLNELLPNVCLLYLLFEPQHFGKKLWDNAIRDALFMKGEFVKLTFYQNNELLISQESEKPLSLIETQENYLHLLRFTFELKKDKLLTAISNQSKFTLKTTFTREFNCEGYFFEPKEGLKEAYSDVKKLLPLD